MNFNDDALKIDKNCQAVREAALDNALKIYKNCQAVREAALGTEHPNTARTNNEIGLVLNRKG